MAYINTCGYETGSSHEIFEEGGSNAVNGNVVRTGAKSLQINPTAGKGRNGFGKMDTAGVKAAIDATFFATVYIRFASLPTGDGCGVFWAAETGDGNNIAVATVDTDGTISLIGSTSSADAGTLLEDIWYRLDMKIVQNGTCELKLDGATAVTCTGNDFTPALVYLGCKATNTVDVHFDDLAINDSAFPGEGEVNLMTPDGNGNYTAFTGVFTAVDEVPHNSDTDFISDATATNAETVTLISASTAGVAGDIGTVKSIAFVRDEGGASSLDIRLRSGTTDDDTANNDPGASYQLRAKMYDTNPDDSGAWASADLDGIEVGVLNNNSVAIRATALYATVWSTGAVPTRRYSQTLLGVG